MFTFNIVVEGKIRKPQLRFEDFIDGFLFTSEILMEGYLYQENKYQEPTWWYMKDSNLQPISYEPIALTI